MKRLCLVLAFLFLFSQTAFAMPLLIGQKVVYRGTITGLRISAVDGTAFIDNAGATIPTYADGNHSIEIYDSSNRMLRGVLKAAGSSETLGDELSVSWTNRASYEFETLTAGAGNTLTSVINTTGAGSAHTVTVTAGQLIKNTNAITLNSGTMPTVALSRFSSGVAGNAWVAFTANGTSYITAVTNLATALTISVGYGVATNFALTEFSAKQVLTPSSSGATIVSAKGGTTYNFNHKNASFTYNAASYYVIIKRLR